MLAVLPLVAFALLFAQRVRACDDWRDAWMEAACAWGVILWAGTELLGALHALDRVGAAALWLAVGLAAAPAGIRAAPALVWQLAAAWATTPLAGRRLLGAIALLAAATGTLGLFCAPNSFDAMTYHAARVMHWMQNRSVDFYPTHIQRQNHFPPWSEFTLLQLRLLAGSDRAFHAVQWFAVFGVLPVVARTASAIGAGPPLQRFAALYAATLPTALLQAVSTQNDATAAFWLAIFVCAAFRLAEGAADRRRLGLVAGAGLGLALLTKSTAYLYAFPFAAGLAVRMLWRERLRALPVLAAIALLALALVAPHALRNQRDYASPLGPTVENYAPEPLAYTVEAPGPRSFALNAVRNLALHLVPPGPDLAAALERGIVAGLARLGLDASDPRSTWQERLPNAPAFRGFRLKPHGADEYYTGAPLHLLLAGAALLGALRRPRAPRRVLALFAGVACGAALFCLVLRWQPWHARLHLPLFLLAAPAVAAGLARVRPRVLAGLALLLFLPTPYYVLANALHPLPEVLGRPRSAQLFAGQRHLRSAYVQAANLVVGAGYRNVGLVTAENAYEYPLWALLEEHPGIRRIEHVRVANASARHALPEFSPDVVVCLACDPRPLLADPRLGPPFQLSQSDEPASLVLVFPLRMGTAEAPLRTAPAGVP